MEARLKPPEYLSLQGNYNNRDNVFIKSKVHSDIVPLTQRAFKGNSTLCLLNANIHRRKTDDTISMTHQ